MGTRQSNGSATAPEMAAEGMSSAHIFLIRRQISIFGYMNKKCCAAAKKI